MNLTLYTNPLSESGCKRQTRSPRELSTYMYHHGYFSPLVESDLVKSELNGLPQLATPLEFVTTLGIFCFKKRFLDFSESGTGTHFTAKSIWQVICVLFELFSCCFCCAFCYAFAWNIISWVWGKFPSCFVHVYVFSWQIIICRFFSAFSCSKIAGVGFSVCVSSALLLLRFCFCLGQIGILTGLKLICYMFCQFI